MSQRLTLQSLMIQHLARGLKPSQVSLLRRISDGKWHEERKGGRWYALEVRRLPLGAEIALVETAMPVRIIVNGKRMPLEWRLTEAGRAVLREIDAT
jgi:hypothetical protein